MSRSTGPALVLCAGLLLTCTPFALFASRSEARSADWALIRSSLEALAGRDVSALVWFALPDGNYWSVQQGHSTGRLARGRS